MSSNERRVLALLVVSAFICLVDRTVLSAAATNLQSSLALSNTQLGALLSAFFWSYAGLQLFSISGRLVDRFHAGWVLAGGFLLWSTATALTAAASGFWAVFTLRVLLGAGESVAYPAYSRILAGGFAEHHRGFANSLIDSSTKVAPALATLAGGYAVMHYGWRRMFFVVGALALLWLVPWIKWMPRGEGVAAIPQAANVPTALDILRQRAAWAMALGQFCSNYFWYFLITWLPAYLEKDRHFAKDKMAVFGSLSFLVIAATSVTCGWLSDRLIARGGDAGTVRKSFAGTGLALSTIIMPVALVREEVSALTLLFLACGAFGIYTPNLFAMTQRLAGPLAAGKWTSMQNGFANTAGVIAPIVTGWLVERTGQFSMAFALAAAAALAGAFFLTVGVGPLEPVKFRTSRP